MTDIAAYTLMEFLEAHRFSRAHYYDLKREGKAPREIRLGKKILISREAAAEWRRRMENEAGEDA